MLNKYNIDDANLANKGEFTNQALQYLYDDLFIQSDISLLEALKVNVSIEDLDINDKDDFEDRADKLDILNTIHKLKCDSGNHMRSYYDEIFNNGFNYNFQFISTFELTEISSTPNE